MNLTFNGIDISNYINFVNYRHPYTHTLMIINLFLPCRTLIEDHYPFEL